MENFGFPTHAPSGDILLDSLAFVGPILFIWSVVNLWASWQILTALRSLVTERRELRRWKRLSMLHDKQQRQWN